jgi:hypothetical protein
MAPNIKLDPADAETSAALAFLNDLALGAIARAGRVGPGAPLTCLSVRYADTASRSLSDTIYGWLQGLLPSARVFAVQSGYYTFEALAAFSSEIEALLAGGGRFDLVIGANEERLNAQDLQRTLDLLGPHIGGNASFTLVGARNGLFHPKAYYIELVTGQRHAAVSSANFTASGIGHHIEASILFDESDDPNAVAAVGDAISAWREKAAGGAREARPVSSQYLRQLQAERAIDPLAMPARRNSAFASATGKSSFPPLGRIPHTPAPRRRTHPASAPGVRLGGAARPLPPGMVGIVKRLSARTDVKGFTGGRGTPYIALPPNPADLAPCLPMRPLGRRNEPRLDVLIEARLYEAPQEIVNSGRDTTNITYVGMGTTRSGNVDLRLNIQHGIAAGLRYIAAQYGLTLPQGGDFAAVELLEDGRLLRLTFVSSDPMRQTLESLLRPGRKWGWLPDGVLPGW